MSEQCNSCRLSRRQFLKLGLVTVGAAALPLGAEAANSGSATAASGGDNAHVPSMLIDVSRCIGCGNCQRGCSEANGLDPQPDQVDKLSAQTFTYLDKVDVKADETRFVKRQCMHCLDAACASACPVSALHRSPEGPVDYNPNICLGCRYCMVSCPFGVPAYEWHDGLTPKVRKCMFCIERQREGLPPACVASCPSGALKVGSRADMLAEAHARIAAHPEHYVNHVFGETEAGGTAMLYISDVPFEQLHFRTDVTKRAVPGYTWDVMSKLPTVVGSLAVVLTGASLITRRRGGHHDEPTWLTEDDDASHRASNEGQKGA